VTFRNDTVVLSGTLFLPTGKENVPAVVFMHGSGNEQRFASTYIAAFLGKKGIASLIYDKRGTGKSAGNWRKSTFEDLANDAIAGCNFLESNRHVNPNKIGIYGHSQGGSICPLVLNKYPKILFGISAASSGVSMMESDWYEVQNRFKNYATGDAYKNAMSVMEKYLEYAATGNGYVELVNVAKRFENEKWFQDYIGPIDTSIFFFRYYRKIAQYNPVNQWRHVKQPCLILKGDNDQTAPGYPTFQNIEDALKQAGNDNYRIVIFKNTNHEMQISGSRNDFWFKATPGYCDTIYNWLDQKIIKESQN
jgi:dipeptidyl aminopeptidase/acylaminoacyl peptidase